MAGMFNKLLDIVGWEVAPEEEDIYDDGPEDNVRQPQQQQPKEAAPRAGRRETANPQGKVVNLNQGASEPKVIVRAPQNILEIKELVDHLRARRTVIMNVEKVDASLAQRMVDFLSGAVYCVDGDMEKLSAGIIIAVPNGVEITGDFRDDIRSKGVFNWAR